MTTIITIKSRQYICYIAVVGLHSQTLICFCIYVAAKKCYKVMYLVTSIDLSSFDEKGYAYNNNFVLLFQFYLKRTLFPKPPLSQQQTRWRFENG